MIAAITLAAGLAPLSHQEPATHQLRLLGAPSAGASTTQARRAYRSAASATGNAGLVYVADAGDNAVYVYNNVPNAAAVRAIAGLNNPQGVAVDGNGNLYVANTGANDVLVYAPGSSTPSRTYAQGLNAPSAVAVSSTGVVYVTNTFGGSVVVYPPGSTTPSTTWQSPLANSGLFGVALQTAAGGDAYVSYEAAGVGGVLRCTVGVVQCADIGLSVPGAFAVAAQYNVTPLTLLVSDVQKNVVDVFHIRRGTTAAQQLAVPSIPAGIAFDASFSHVFAASQRSVNEYTYPRGTLVQSFPAPASAKTPFLTGVAVYPSTSGPAPLAANLFVANYSNTISPFDTAAGFAALPPFAGVAANTYKDAALAPNGRLFIADESANNVTIFDTLDGDVPIGVISGGGLNGPSGEAIDSAGNLYVANESGNSVSVFSAANGYAPATILTGGLNGPAGIAVDVNANLLYVVNARDLSLSSFVLTPNASSQTGFSYRSYVKFLNLGLEVPMSLAVDAAGTVYCANFFSNSVSVLKPRNLGAGTIVAPPITGNGLNAPRAVAVDATGKLYVISGVNTIIVFDTTRGNALVTTISGNGLNHPKGLAVH